ncbi:MAG: DUF485 domain-containing protein [Rhodospirillales bacterium]|nr:DUF485 domain-containing protein [Rhodospirillales bacterium]
MAHTDPRLHSLAARRWRIAIWLSVFMLLAYYAFILLVAFDKPLLGVVLTQGLTLGILLGALVIVFAWVLTFIYVGWANGKYDHELAELRR